MKEPRSLFRSLFVGALALAMVSSLSAQTISSAKVIRVKGPARYTTGNNIWQPLSVGTVLQPGSVVQTSTERGSYVDLVLGEVGTDAGTSPVIYRPAIISSLEASTTSYRFGGDQNVVRVWENSALGIDKLTSMNTGADAVCETQLDLKAGRITGNVKKMSAASKYEVKLPNGVAGIRGTTYDISADGVVKVYVGSVVVATVDSKTGNVVTQVVSGGQQYDSRTNQTTPLSPSDVQAGDEIAKGMRYVESTGLPRTFAFDKTIIMVSPVQ
jgi:hypothetical protein